MPYDNQKVFKIEALSFCCWLCRYRKQIISIQKSVKNTSVFGIIHRSSHKARKTQISTLLDWDVNLDTVRRVSGHVDSRTTLNNYCFDRTEENERKKKIFAALDLT